MKQPLSSYSFTTEAGNYTVVARSIHEAFESLAEHFPDAGKVFSYKVSLM